MPVVWRWARRVFAASNPWQAQRATKVHACSIRLRKLAVKFNNRSTSRSLARKEFFETSALFSARMDPTSYGVPSWC